MIAKFEDFELDPARFELRRAGVPVPVERRVFDLILYLASNSDRVISKEELLRTLWAGRHVTDGSLSVAIAAARRALGDDASAQRIIRTRHGRGYQLVPRSASPSKSASANAEDLNRSDLRLSTLVGREGEISILARAGSRLLQGSSTVLLISGEPGIGKTRLFDEFTRISRDLGFLFSFGRCAETGDAPAMWPWSQIVRELHRHQPSGWQERIASRHRRPLAMIAPEIFLDISDSGSLPEHPDAVRFRLYEALVEVLDSILQNQRIAIGLDDLHRADTSTLGLFRFAARELRQSPIILLAAHRLSELRDLPIHAHALTELARLPTAISMRLGSLSPPETQRLFSSLSKDMPSPKAISRIYEQTGGNPFFIKQLAVLSSAHWQSDTRSSRASLPPTLRNAILEQTAGLSRSARTVLNAAAVIGREFSVHAMAELVQPYDLVDLQTSIDELLDSFVVRRADENPNHFEFSHILVRDALYASLGAAERRALHRSIGHYLASRHGIDSEQHAGEIAYHLFESQDAESLVAARAYSETAALAASRRSAHDDAERHYIRALQVLASTDPSNDQERCRLLLALGKEQCQSGNRSLAKKTFNSAASVARALGSTESLARAALGVAPGFLAAEAGASDVFLQDLLTESLAETSPTNPSLRARIAARLAMALHWSESPGRMQDAIALAWELSEQAKDPFARLHVLVARWFCEWNHKELGKRSAIAEEIQSLAESLRDREMILMGMMLRQVGMLERGDTSAFDVSLQVFEGLALELRQPQSLWYTPAYRSMRALLDGRLDEAKELVERLTATAARLEDANAFHSLTAQRALLARESGCMEQMIPMISEGVRRFPGLQGFRAGLGWAYASLYRHQDAEREYSVVAAASFQDFPERFDWSSTAAFAAEVCSDLGDACRSRLLYEMLAPTHNQHLLLGLGVLSFGSADRLLARLSETMGLGEQAEAHFRVALERNAAAGAHAWTAHTKFDYARFLARSAEVSRRDYWMQLASEAFEAATGLGMTNLQGRSEAFLQGYPDDRQNTSRA